MCNLLPEVYPNYFMSHVTRVEGQVSQVSKGLSRNETSKNVVITHRELNVQYSCLPQLTKTKVSQSIYNSYYCMTARKISEWSV